MVTLKGNYSTINHGTHTEYKINSGIMTAQVHNGDTLANVHFNFTRSGTGVRVFTTPSWWGTPPARWTIRNVGFSGKLPSYTKAAPLMAVSCTDRGLVENCYLGDGAVAYPKSGGWNNHPTGIIVNPTNSGTLTFRGVNTQRWVDNGIYASPPGKPGPGRGHIHFENCFSRRNTISCFRCGTKDRVTNCYAENVSGNHRGLWVYNTSSADCRVENSHLRDTGGTYALNVSSGGTARMKNSHWNTQAIAGRLVDNGGNSRSPKYFEPAGCPMTAKEAYTGSPGSGSGGTPLPDNPENVIEIAGELDYAFTASERVTPHEDIAQWVQYGEAYGDDWVDWYLTGSHTKWYFEDTIDEFELAEHEGEFRLEYIKINGETINSSDVTDWPDIADDPEPEPQPDPPDPDDPILATHTAEEVRADGVTLAGALHDLGAYDRLALRFLIREQGESDWPVAGPNRVTSEPINLTQPYPTDTGYPQDYFEPGTTYEFTLEAAPDANDDPGSGHQGQRRTFTTLLPPDPEPGDPTRTRSGSFWYVADPDDVLFGE